MKSSNAQNQKTKALRALFFLSFFLFGLNYSNGQVTTDNHTIIGDGTVSDPLKVDTMIIQDRRYIKTLEQFDILDAPINSLITLESSGAVYKIRTDPVVGIAVGGEEVRCTPYGFAVLQPEHDFIRMSWFSGSDNEKLDKAAIYCTKNGNSGFVLMDQDTVYLTESVLMRAGVVFDGTSANSGHLNGSNGTLVIADLNDVNEPVFVTDAVPSYTTDTGIRNVSIIAKSPALCAVHAIRPALNLIEKLNINGGISRSFKYGLITESSIDQEYRDLTISNIDQACVYYKLGNFGGTTTDIKGGWFKLSRIGIFADSASAEVAVEDIILEKLDSSAIISENGNIIADHIYCENCSYNTSSSVIQAGLKMPTGAIAPRIVISNSQIQVTGMVDLTPMINVDRVGKLVVENTQFLNGLQTLQTTSNTGGIKWSGNIERNGSHLVNDLKGITDTSKLVMICNTTGITSKCKNYFGQGTSFDLNTTDDLTYIDGELGLNYSYTGNRVYDLNSYNLQYSDLGKVLIGGADFGFYQLQVAGQTYSSIGYKTANSFGLSGFKAGENKSLNMIATDSNNDIVIGQTDMEDIRYIAGAFASDSESGDHHQWFTSHSETMRLTGAGKLMIGRTTSLGSFNLQVENGAVVNTGDFRISPLQNANFLSTNSSGDLEEGSLTDLRDALATVSTPSFGYMTFANNSHTIIASGSGNYDPITNATGNLFSNTFSGEIAASGDVITINCNCDVEVNVNFSFSAGNGSGYRIKLLKNGVVVSNVGMEQSMSGSDVETGGFTYIYTATSGDIIEPVFEEIAGTTDPTFIAGSISVVKM